MSTVFSHPALIACVPLAITFPIFHQTFSTLFNLFSLCLSSVRYRFCTLQLLPTLAFTTVLCLQLSDQVKFPLKQRGFSKTCQTMPSCLDTEGSCKSHCETWIIHPTVTDLTCSAHQQGKRRRNAAAATVSSRPIYNTITGCMVLKSYNKSTAEQGISGHLILFKGQVKFSDVANKATDHMQAVEMKPISSS